MGGVTNHKKQDPPTWYYAERGRAASKVYATPLGGGVAYPYKQAHFPYVLSHQIWSCCVN